MSDYVCEVCQNRVLHESFRDRCCTFCRKRFRNIYNHQYKCSEKKDTKEIQTYITIVRFVRLFSCSMFQLSCFQTPTDENEDVDILTVDEPVDKTVHMKHEQDYGAIDRYIVRFCIFG